MADFKRRNDVRYHIFLEAIIQHTPDTPLKNDEVRNKYEKTGFTHTFAFRSTDNH